MRDLNGNLLANTLVGHAFRLESHERICCHAGQGSQCQTCAPVAWWPRVCEAVRGITLGRRVSHLDVAIVASGRTACTVENQPSITASS
jgi:hypothetical protein